MKYPNGKTLVRDTSFMGFIIFGPIKTQHQKMKPPFLSDPVRYKPNSWHPGDFPKQLKKTPEARMDKYLKFNKYCS